MQPCPHPASRMPLPLWLQVFRSLFSTNLHSFTRVSRSLLYNGNFEIDIEIGGICCTVRS